MSSCPPHRLALMDPRGRTMVGLPMSAAGLALVAMGGVLFLWGALGRFADRHSYSEDDGTLMLFGGFLGFWGGFLILVAST